MATAASHSALASARTVRSVDCVIRLVFRLKGAERDPAHRVLLKVGMVFSLDPQVGDFAHADILIEGKKILAVGRNLSTAALVVDAAGMIIMPGFVDTHHHQYETILRGILADGVLGSPGDGKKTYQGVIQGVFIPVYQPEDAYISELVASLNQLNAGVTTHGRHLAGVAHAGPQ